MHMDSSPQDKYKVVYVVSDELAKVSAALPSNRGRSIAVHSLVNKLGLLGMPTSSSEGAVGAQQGRVKAAKPIRPRYATRKELCQYHDEEYINFVLDPRHSQGSPQDASEFGIEDDCPPFPLMHKYVPLVAGASLVAAEALFSGTAEVAICWDGGRHHAQKSTASGFCYVADCILAILSLKRPQNSIRPRVMYLDLDLHFSDAVSHAFHSNSRASPTSGTSSQVLTFSIHHTSPGFFPVSALSTLPPLDADEFDPFTISLPLRQGASAPTFSRVWKHVERAKEVFRPDYVIVQCGVDGSAGDPYSVWNWSTGMEEGEMGWCVQQVLRWGCKVLLLGGGGYSTPNAARAWTMLTSIAVGSPLSPETEIPDHFAFPMYAPSFTLGVSPGNMVDTNDDEYIAVVDSAMSRILDRLEERMR